KGFAISTRGRPTIFKPEPPAKIKEKVIERLGESFDKLDMMHEILRDKGEPQLVYTVAGNSRVMEKIGEMLDTATGSVTIATPAFYEIRERLAKKIENAMQRSVQILLITEPGQKVPEGAKVYYRKGLIATDIIADGERAMIASPDLPACGLTDNAALAAHLDAFLEIFSPSGRRIVIDGGETEAVVVDRAMFDRAIVTDALRKGVHSFLGAQAAAARREDGRVEVLVDVDGETQRFRCKLLIGADGVR